jgi:hypothetical protein
MTTSGDWPIVVTNRCADACAETLGLGTREHARAWLQDLIAHRGVVTKRLPEPMSGRRSPSGQFLLVDGVLVLPLAADRDGEHKWIATNCLVFPGHRASGGQVDPFALRGRELLEQVNLLSHAVDRFQQRCGGSPDPQRARAELVERLAPTVRAQQRPPAWCGTRPAEFYLVAGEHDEYCLPCRNGSGSRPFDATTCIHEATDLFALTKAQLAARCRVEPSALPERGRHQLAAAFKSSGSLTWHKPRWARGNSKATWWIVFDGRVAAPVSWDPGKTARPLLVVGLTDGRSLLARLFSRFRRS